MSERKTIKLVLSSGVLWDEVEVSEKLNLPKVVLSGVGSAQKCFVRDGNRDIQCSCMDATPPAYMQSAI
jgi:hypothetical protein